MTIPLASNAAITLEDAKKHLSLKDDNLDTDLLHMFINAVSSNLERRLGRVFAAQSFTELHNGSGTTSMRVKRFPVISITSITHIGVDGSVIETVDSSKYYAADEAGLIRMYEGYSFDAGIDNYSIVYTAGFSTVPAEIQLAARLLLARAWRDWEHKEESDIKSVSANGETITFDSGEWPKSVRALTKPFKVPYIC